jgi:hypothetical protein
MFYVKITNAFKAALAIIPQKSLNGQRLVSLATVYKLHI